MLNIKFLKNLNFIFLKDWVSRYVHPNYFDYLDGKVDPAQVKTLF